MKILLSCAGYSDPIRNYHDGALLHIARVKRPDKIIIIHSEDSQKRAKNIVFAINKISKDYKPEIIEANKMITDVAYFDKVFHQLSAIVSEYTNDTDEFILNLSSGTPQMKSAFFAINQIYDYNFQAVQVLTPAHSANTGIKHETNEDIISLVETNYDNQDSFENRLVVDKAVKFSQTLTIRNFLALIDQYDYIGARDLIQMQKGFPNRKVIFNRLDREIIPDLQQNKLPKEIQKLSASEDFKKTLYSFLIIQMKYERGEIAEVLIRIQSLVEYVLAYYLSKHYPNIFREKEGVNYLNAKEYPKIESYLISEAKEAGRIYRDNFLGLMKYYDILYFLDSENQLLEEVKPIIEVRHMRNSVAHRLDEIPNWNYRKIRQAYRATENIMNLVFKFSDSSLSFYDNINDELRSYFT